MSLNPQETRLSRARPALEAFLARAAGAEAAILEEARPLTGGAIQENWLIDLRFQGGAYDGHQALVLRSDAPSAVAVSLTRAQEFRLLQVAQAAGVSVPAPLWLCEDSAILGRPFYVMRRLAGTALGNRLVKDESLGGDRTALAERLGREMARIHSVLPPRADLDFLAMPEGAPGLADVARHRAHLDALGQPRPALEWALRWAELQAPARGEIVLLHQDFRTGNYMVDEQGLTGILDWEFSSWGDPMSDIGWFCARCWRFGRDEREAGGIAERAPFYRGYEAESGRPIDHDAVAFWEVMAHIRWAVIALQQGERHISGEQPSLDLALTGRRVAELEHEVLNLTEPPRWSAAR